MRDGHRERVRESFLKGGLKQFSEYRALELVLFYSIPRKDTTDLAHNLVDHFGSLSAVFDAPISELLEFEGVGESSAILIKLFPEIYKKCLAEKNELTVLESTEALGDFCVSLFASETVEKAYILCFDCKNKLINKILVAEGSLSTISLDKRRLMEAAVRNSTVSVVLTHNHPNGVAAPSAADVKATRDVRGLMNSISIKFADHIIVADGGYFSMSGHVKFFDLFA